MNDKLLKQATLGAASDPWGTLLHAGASSLVDAVNAPIARLERGASFSAPESQKAASQSAANLLIDKLSNDKNALWYLSIVKDLGLRVPSSRTFDFLNALSKAASKIDVEDYIEALGGATGLFLLKTYPERWKELRRILTWSKTTDPDALEAAVRATIENGPKSDLGRGFRALRRVAPERARKLFPECVKKYKDAKRDVLSAFVVNLSEEDVPLLEEALGKKSSPQHAVVERLLALIPNTKQSLKALEEADKYLPSLGEIDVASPSTNSDVREYALLRENSPLSTVEALDCVPLSHWEEKFHATPAEIVAAYPVSCETAWLYAKWINSLAYFGRSDAWAWELSSLIFYRAFNKYNTVFPFPTSYEAISQEDSLDKLKRTILEKFPEESYRRLVEEGVRKFYFSNDVNSKNVSKNRLVLALRRQFERKPWSREFSEEYIRLYFSDELGAQDETGGNRGASGLWQVNAAPLYDFLSEDVLYFSAEYRAKILQILSESNFSHSAKYRELRSTIETSDRFLNFLYGRNAQPSSDKRPQAE